MGEREVATEDRLKRVRSGMRLEGAMAEREGRRQSLRQAASARGKRSSEERARTMETRNGKGGVVGDGWAKAGLKLSGLKGANHRACRWPSAERRLLVLPRVMRRRGQCDGRVGRSGGAWSVGRPSVVSSRSTPSPEAGEQRSRLGHSQSSSLLGGGRRLLLLAWLVRLRRLLASGAECLRPRCNLAA